MMRGIRKKSQHKTPKQLALYQRSTRINRTPVRSTILPRPSDTKRIAALTVSGPSSPIFTRALDKMRTPSCLKHHVLDPPRFLSAGVDPGSRRIAPHRPVDWPGEIRPTLSGITAATGKSTK